MINPKDYPVELLAQLRTRLFRTAQEEHRFARLAVREGQQPVGLYESAVAYMDATLMVDEAIEASRSAAKQHSQ